MNEYRSAQSLEGLSNPLSKGSRLENLYRTVTYGVWWFGTRARFCKTFDSLDVLSVEDYVRAERSITCLDLDPNMMSNTISIRKREEVDVQCAQGRLHHTQNFFFSIKGFVA